MSTKPLRKAVFPVAGLGTRFLPATKTQPKVMLPLVDKPIIHYVVEEALSCDLNDIIFVTGRGQHSIENYFDVAIELQAHLEAREKYDELEAINSLLDRVHPCYVRQREARGLGHAVSIARNLVGDEPFAVFLADDVIDAPVPCIRQMLDVYEKYERPVVALERVDPDKTRSYGIVSPRHVEGGLYEILDMVEKPQPRDAPSDLAIIGRYILTPDIFVELERTQPGQGGEIQLTDALTRLLDQGPIYGFAFEGTRYDTGDKLGFLKATVQFALRRGDLGGDFRDYLENLDR